MTSRENGKNGKKTGNKQTGLFFVAGVHPPRDLVAQERSRARAEKNELPESVVRRTFTDHAPAQRGRPPLRRTEPELSKTGSDHVILREERRATSYRGRGYGFKQQTRTLPRFDPADDFTWRCNQCFKAFTNREQLEVHQCNGIGSGKNLTCTQCNQSFAHPIEYRAHMESHVNERPFRCGYCASAFASAALLNQHVRVHMTDGSLGTMKFSPKHDRLSQEFQFWSPQGIGDLQDHFSLLTFSGNSQLIGNSAIISLAFDQSR